MHCVRHMSWVCRYCEHSPARTIQHICGDIRDRTYSCVWETRVDIFFSAVDDSRLDDYSLVRRNEIWR